MHINKRFCMIILAIIAQIALYFILQGLLIFSKDIFIGVRNSNTNQQYSNS